ncbi:hypothetical protein F5X96DRAFT_627747 [Biscogniauxia mediterranea]|nr:hypothetical protein F5X96DRAFT_627747 [Biscogniauxia mediterranea]
MLVTTTTVMQRNSHLAPATALLCLARMALGAEIEGPDQGIDPSIWSAAMAAPNATATVPIRGFNISGAYSEQEISGWSMSIRVAADRETGWKDDDTGAADLSGGYFVATSISIQAPDALLLLSTDGGGGGASSSSSSRTVKVAANPEWAVSAWPSIHLSENITAAAQNDDGSCLSFLPEQCIKDWQDEYVTSGPEYHAPPSSCNSTLRDVIQLTNENHNTVPLQMFNGTELIGWSNTYDDLDRRVDKLAAATRRVWSVMMVYRQSGQHGTASVAARLACIRAKDIAQGSTSTNSHTTITAEEMTTTTNAAGARYPVWEAWALGLLALLVFLVL